LPKVKAWTEGDVHYEADVVTHNGATWQALRDTGRKPGEADWIMLARAGLDAQPFNVRGTFSETIADYKKFDVVALNGSSFVARSDKPGACPGPGWQLIASAGRPGKPGPKGERGEKGLPGAQGQQGDAAPIILAWKIDRQNFSVTPIMSDASEVPPIELRDLFEQFQIETH
jgi:hypothetical protein